MPDIFVSVSITLFLVAVLAWRKRRSFARFWTLLKHLWLARPRIWPILKKKRVRWFFRRTPKHQVPPRDSDIVEEVIEEIGEDEPFEARKSV